MKKTTIKPNKSKQPHTLAILVPVTLPDGTLTNGWVEFPSPSRETLRSIAKTYGVRRGHTTEDTVRNLLTSRSAALVQTTSFNEVAIVKQ